MCVSELELESELSSEVVKKSKWSHVQIVKMSEFRSCKNVGESGVGVTERRRSSEYSNGIGVKGRNLVGVRSSDFGVQLSRDCRKACVCRSWSWSQS